MTWAGREPDQNQTSPACCPMDDWDHFESLKEKIGMPFP
jgi:hypothetical protein